MRMLALLVALVSWGASAAVTADESVSAPMAQKLGALLQERKLDSIAARMPGETDQFAAALYYPGSQLLVITARYRAPRLMREQVLTGKYRDAYVALNGSGDRDGRFSVVDLDADGLMPTRSPNGRFDTIYERVTRRTVFDGDWKKQKLSESQYHQKFTAADARYAKVLSALIEQLSVLTQ